MKVNKSFYCLIIITVTTIAYWNSFDVPFQFDDHHSIQNNPGIRNLSDLKRVFNSFPQRPVAQLTFALNYHFHELDVWGYHLVNLIIHIINALLVFLLVLQILNLLKETDRISLKNPEILFVAFSTGLLFAVHPIQTQAVTYIVQRMASLASLFYLLAVNCFLKGRSILSKNKFAWIWFVLSGLSGLLGLFTKQIVFTFPLMILMLEWILYDDIGTFLKKKKKTAIIVAVVFMVFLLILPLWYKLDFSKIFKTIPPEQGHTYTLTPYNYFLTQLRVHITYLRLIFLPINQHLDYDYPISESLFEWKVTLSGLFLLMLIILSILYRRKYPILSISILWYFIASSVESSIMPIGNVIFEHRLYLPIIGIILLLTKILFMIFKNRVTFVLLFIFILSIYLTHKRNNVWKSEKSLWEESYVLSPQKARPKNNYSSFVLREHKYLEGFIILNNIMLINPEYFEHKENLYRLRLDVGDKTGADSMDILESKGHSILKYYIYRNKYKEANDYISTLNLYDLNPDDIKMLMKVSIISNFNNYKILKDYSIKNNYLTNEEKYYFEMIEVDLNPKLKYKSDWIRSFINSKNKATILYKLSRQSALEKDYETALNYIMDALELDNRSEFYHMRAVIFNNTGNYLYAAMDYTSAFKLSGDPEFVKMRAMCYERMGHEESAKNEWRYYEILREKEGEKEDLPQSTLRRGE